MDFIKAKAALAPHLPLLLSSTSNDESPTPGYMLPDIAKLTNVSVVLCNEVENFYIKRVDKNSCNVKLKALRILKYLAEHGHSSVKRDLTMHTDAISQAMKFRGPGHPVHGDGPNQMVRTAASELMELINDAISAGPQQLKYTGGSSYGQQQQQQQQQQYQHQQGGGSQGQGQRSMSSAGPPPLGTGRYMEGIGSSPVQQQPASLMDRFKSVINTDGRRQSSPGGEMHHQHNGAYQGGPWRPASTASPTSAGGGGASYQPSAFPAPSSYAVKSEPVPLDEGHHHEERLVNEITAPGGVKAAPPRDQLNTFVKRCASLDCNHIAQLLIDKLNMEDGGTSNSVKTRSLFVVEALLRSDIVGIETCLSSMRNTLERLSSLGASSGASQAVCDKALKVQLALDRAIESSAPSASPAVPVASTSAPTPTVAPTSAGNILDLDFDVSSVAPADTASAQSLLEGMNLSTSTPTATTNAASAPPSGYDIDRSLFDLDDSTPATTAAPSTGSMFSNMNVSQQSPSAAPTSSMFSNMTVTPTTTTTTTTLPTTAPPATTSNMFSNMTVAPASGAAAPSSNGGGMFSNMNVSASPSPAASAPSAVASANFDLLAGLDQSSVSSSSNTSLLDLMSVSRSSVASSSNYSSLMGVATQHQQQQSPMMMPPQQQQQQQQHPTQQRPKYTGGMGMTTLTPTSSARPAASPDTKSTSSSNSSGFGFLSSGKADSFSFVADQMQASKK